MPNHRWQHKFSHWVLRLSAPDSHRSRATATGIIAAIVLLIGWVDFLTGPRVLLVLFYLGPILLSVAWLGWRSATVTCAVSVVIRWAGDMATGGYPFGPWTVFWNRTADFLLYLVIAAIFQALLSLQRQLEQRVRERTAELEQAIAARNELQTQLFEVSRRERSAIGHELHDGLGQHLTATSYAADLLAGKLAASAHPATESARGIVRLVQEGIAKTRQIARGLLLAEIQPDELVAQLGEMAATLTRETHVTCRFTARDKPAGLDVAAASHVFYIAQEAARNAVRHAQATQVEINLANDDTAIVLTVADNGCGFRTAGDSPGMGLRIMAHRAELIGGTYTQGPAPGGGTLIACRVPRHATNATSPAT